MLLYAKLLREYLAENPSDYGSQNIHSLVEMLYRHYTEYNPIDTEEIRTGFRNLRNRLRHLPPQEFDQVLDLVCGICCEHERSAFQKGFQAGTQLSMELLEQHWDE